MTDQEDIRVLQDEIQDIKIWRRGIDVKLNVITFLGASTCIGLITLIVAIVGNHL